MSYIMCRSCDHFIERNIDADEPNPYGLAEWVHLDHGDKDHDHDASPGAEHTLAEWRAFSPELFQTYADGLIGPNSRYYVPR